MTEDTVTTARQRVQEFLTTWLGQFPDNRQVAWLTGHSENGGEAVLDAADLQALVAETAVSKVEALGTVEHGAVLLLRVREAHQEASTEVTSIINEIARVAGHRNFILIAATPECELGQVDEESMNANGWYRRPF